MGDDRKTLTLIGSDFPAAGGPAAHGPPDGLESSPAARGLFEKKIDAKTVERRLQETMAAVSETVKSAYESSPLAWPLAAVTVALSVSMQGSIGIASAGSTAAIQLTFAPPGAGAVAADSDKKTADS